MALARRRTLPSRLNASLLNIPYSSTCGRISNYYTYKYSSTRTRSNANRDQMDGSGEGPLRIG